jgi:hypothetical protein
MKNCYVLFLLIAILALTFAVIPSWGAMKVDIGISTQAGWMGQAAADREMQLIVDTVKNKVNDIQLFPVAKQAELADWVTKHTGNKQLDVLILCGQFPNTIYKPGNAQPNGSIAEKFLEDGNMIANTGDWMFYVVDGAGTNATGGLQNMMDIPGITMDGEGDNQPMVVTADGKKYLPTLQDYATDRPFHVDKLVKPWEAEVIFAQNGAGTRVEPFVVKDTSNSGRIVTFYQTASQDADPRGKVISEFIINWLPTIAGKISVESEGKLSILWGELKVSK